jgi:hypothetical protein
MVSWLHTSLTTFSVAYEMKITTIEGWLWLFMFIIRATQEVAIRRIMV